jgi:hypothetical protein
MIDDENSDPLNIGHCRLTMTIIEQPPPRIISLHGPHTTDLFSEQTSLKRTKSLKTISKLNRETFDLEMQNVPRSVFASNPSWSSCHIPDVILKPIYDKELHLFDRFVTHQPISESTERATKAFIATRRQLFFRSVEHVDKLFNQHKLTLNQCINDRADEEHKISELITNWQGFVRRGLDSQRKNAVILLMLHRTQVKIFKHQSRDLTRELESIVAFRDLLETFSDVTDELYPSVDFVGFQRSIQNPNPRIKVLEKHRIYLQAHKKELVHQKPGTGDWEFNLLHPKTKSGKVIRRFEEKIESLRYEDVSSIIEHLCVERSEFRRIENFMFDLAWCKQSYPFGFSGKRHQAAKNWVLPVKGDMFPAVIAPTSLSPEIAFTPFSVLNGLRWPFKPAVDKIFEMMILTNPFDIARVYWNVIQEAAKCMQRILVISGMNPEDIEIDFDSLFPVLMICVFAFGIDEWMQVATYTVSFSENTGTDPELQFAMTYLEGLVTHIIALDQDTLKRKAAEMRSAWADDQTDPLGLGK